MMKVDSLSAKSDHLRQIAAASILGVLYVASYGLMSQNTMSQCSSSDRLLRIFFSALQLGPLVLLSQWFNHRRFEPAVGLWAAYGGIWLAAVFLSRLFSDSLGFLFGSFFLWGTVPVFLYATFLLGAEIRIRRRRPLIILATLVTLFSSGQVLVDVALCPLVI